MWHVLMLSDMRPLFPWPACATAQAQAAAFIAAPAYRVAERLETLVTLGQAWLTADECFVV